MILDGHIEHVGKRCARGGCEIVGDGLGDGVIRQDRLGDHEDARRTHAQPQLAWFHAHEWRETQTKVVHMETGDLPLQHELGCDQGLFYASRTHRRWRGWRGGR